MAFTSWADLRTAIKDAIADHVAGQPCIGEYSLDNGMRLRYRTYDELIGLLEKTYKLEALDTIGNPANAVSYGRPRRFR